MTGFPDITAEKAIEILKSDPECPAEFDLVEVAYEPDMATFVAKLVPAEAKEFYLRQVAKADAGAAKRAEAAEPEPSFAAFWRNEDPEGGWRYAVQFLDGKEAKNLAKASRRLVPVCGKAKS